MQVCKADMKSQSLGGGDAVKQGGEQGLCLGPSLSAFEVQVIYKTFFISSPCQLDFSNVGAVLPLNIHSNNKRAEPIHNLGLLNP